MTDTNVLEAKPKSTLGVDFRAAPYQPVPIKTDTALAELMAMIDLANTHFDLAGLETSYQAYYAEEDGKKVVCIVGDTAEEQVLAGMIYIAPDGKIDVGFNHLKDDNLSQQETDWTYVLSVMQEALFRTLPTEQQHRFDTYRLQHTAEKVADPNNPKNLREFGLG